MNIKTQIACAWCAIISPTLMFNGMILAGFFPPHLPTSGPEVILELYKQNANEIKIMAILMLIAGATYLPFTAVIAAQMRRIECRETPVLSYTQLGAGMLIGMLFFICAMYWGTGAFRLERNADYIQLMNDLGWLWFVCTIFFGVTQNVSFGIMILTDKNKRAFKDGINRTLFPRWLGYFNIWIALLFLPGALAFFFMTGPFAWNGILAFWVPAIVLGGWLVAVLVCLIKAIRQQEFEGSAGTVSP